MTNNLKVNIESLEILVDEKCVDQALSKSQLFELLYNDYNCTVAEIKHLTGSHYSFIFGVVTKKCEKREVKRTGGKADTIRAMLQAGKTVSEISKELETNYSYVFTVAKKWKTANMDFVPTEEVVSTPVEDEPPLTPFELSCQVEIVEEEKPKKKGGRKKKEVEAE